MENELGGREIKILEEIRKRPCCIEDMAKIFHLSYIYIYRKVRGMKQLELITENRDKYDHRIKNLSLTKKGILTLKKIETKKSMIAKFDVWLEDKFREIGIDFDRRLK